MSTAPSPEVPPGDRAPRTSELPLRVVGICSGKGGVGKTCIAANLSCALAARGHRVLLIDADLGLANAELMFGVQPRKTIADLLEGEELANVLAEGPHGIALLAGGSGIAWLSRISDDQKLTLLGALDQIENAFDTVIVDSGGGIGENVRFFIGAAHQRILVLNPEPTAVADAYATIKVLSESGIRRLDVIVNAARSEREARSVFDALSSLSTQFLAMRIHYLGSLPRDGAVPLSVASACPVIDLLPRAPVSQALNGIADRFLNLHDEPGLDGGLKLMWSRGLSEFQRW